MQKTDGIDLWWQPAAQWWHDPVILPLLRKNIVLISVPCTLLGSSFGTLLGGMIRVPSRAISPCTISTSGQRGMTVGWVFMFTALFCVYVVWIMPVVFVQVWLKLFDFRLSIIRYTTSSMCAFEITHTLKATKVHNCWMSLRCHARCVRSDALQTMWLICIFI